MDLVGRSLVQGDEEGRGGDAVGLLDQLGKGDSFYRFRDLYEKGGEAALIKMSRRVPNPKNRIAEAIERRILELTVEQPA